MSVITAVREYINKMLSEVLGMKALLMDDETVRRKNSSLFVLSLLSVRVEW